MSRCKCCGIDPEVIALTVEVLNEVLDNSTYENPLPNIRLCPDCCNTAIYCTCEANRN